MKVDATVLGGGDGGVIDPRCRFKGLLPIGGRPMIEWVVDALRDAENVAGIAVVVPTAENLGSWADKVDKVVVSDGSFMDNVVAGVSAFRVDRPMLVTTGDIPMVTGAALDDFIGKSLATGADFIYPLITAEAILRAYPGSKRTFLKLDVGEITGGNMMIVNPVLVAQNRDLGQKMFDARKSPLRMARILGFKWAAKFVLGMCTVPELEAKITELLGGKGAALVTEQASIGTDVDKPEDVLTAETALAGRGEAAAG